MELLAVAALSIPLLHADEVSSGVFLASMSDGRVIEGTLREMRSDGSLRLAGTVTADVAANQWIELRRADAKLPPLPQGPHLMFAGGDRVLIAPDSLKVDGEKLRCQPILREAKEWTVPLSALSVVWLAAPDAESDPERLRRRLSGERRARDVVVLRNGDIIGGILNELDAAKNLVKLEIDKRPVEARFDRVAYIALNTELTTAPKPKAAFLHLVLSNGSRLSLTTATADSGSLSGAMLFDSPVQAPLTDIVVLSVRQGPAVYLSDLKPRHFEHTPYLNARWPLVADGSASGRDLVLSENVYDKGLGMHAASRATYDVGDGCQRFETLVGMDDRTGRKGRARIQVLVDSKEAAARDLSGGEEPIRLMAPVAGAKTVTLVVDFGPAGSVQADVDWANARFIK